MNGGIYTLLGHKMLHMSTHHVAIFEFCFVCLFVCLFACLFVCLFDPFMQILEMTLLIITSESLTKISR